MCYEINLKLEIGTYKKYTHSEMFNTILDFLRADEKTFAYVHIEEYNGNTEKEDYEIDLNNDTDLCQF